MKRQREFKVRRWTQSEIDLVHELYPTESNEYLKQLLHRSRKSIMHKAIELGLKKTPEFAKQQRERNQFKKGNVPFNKGKKWEHFMSEEGQRKASKTFFCGNPHNTHAAGTEVLRAEHHGKRYWWIKPGDGRRMMLKHRWLWEKAHGPIPKGYNVQFKDGNPLNCVLDNLYLISRSEQMKENFNRIPADKKAVMWKKIAESRNETIKRDKLRMRWGMPQKTKIKLRPV